MAVTMTMTMTMTMAVAVTMAGGIMPMRPVVARAYVAADANHPVAGMPHGADEADLLGLLGRPCHHARKAHGFGAGTTQRHGSGQCGQCRNCENQTTHCISFIEALRHLAVGYCTRPGPVA